MEQCIILTICLIIANLLFSSSMEVETKLSAIMRDNFNKKVNNQNINFPAENAYFLFSKLLGSTFFLQLNRFQSLQETITITPHDCPDNKIWSLFLKACITTPTVKLL